MDIQFPQILFQIINFGVVLAAITYLLYKPIQKVLDERVDRIVAGQKAAEEAQQKKQSSESEAATIRQEAEKKAAAYIEEVMKKAKQQKAEMIDQAKSEAEATVAKLKANWDTEKAKLASQAQAGLVMAVMTVSEKVIGKKLDQKSDEKMISESLDETLAKL